MRPASHRLIEGQAFLVFEGTDVGSSGHDVGKKEIDRDTCSESDSEAEPGRHHSEILQGGYGDPTNAPKEEKNRTGENGIHGSFHLSGEGSVVAELHELFFELLGKSRAGCGKLGI